MKRLKFGISAILLNLAIVACLLLVGCGGGGSAPDEPNEPRPRPNPSDDPYDVYRPDPRNAATIHETGWRPPLKLGVNTDSWEDSPFLTRDGKSLLYFFHPSTRLTDPAEERRVAEYVNQNRQRAIADGNDGKVYVSARPFMTRAIHPISQNKIHPSADACPYISLGGDVYHCSTLEAFEINGSAPPKNYRNGDRLELGTGGEEVNAHYCDARDELWFDCPGDQQVCVMQNAAQNGFGGTSQEAPSPINFASGANDSQPFLTDDCQTLFFTSDRNSGVLTIYRSRRQGQSWSTPEPFVSHPTGVAELTMTSDGRSIAWAQLFRRSDGSVGLDIWYAEKE